MKNYHRPPSLSFLFFVPFLFLRAFLFFSQRKEKQKKEKKEKEKESDLGILPGGERGRKKKSCLPYLKKK